MQQLCSLPLAAQNHETCPDADRLRARVGGSLQMTPRPYDKDYYQAAWPSWSILVRVAQHVETVWGSVICLVIDLQLLLPVLKSFLPWEDREDLAAPREIRLCIYRIYRLNHGNHGLFRRLHSGFQLHSSQASICWFYIYFAEPYAGPLLNDILYTFIIQLIQVFFVFLVVFSPIAFFRVWST